MSDKRATIESFLAHQYCLIHIHPGVQGTVLPPSFAKEVTVTLKISHYFSGYVSIENEILKTELTFGTSPFECTIPLKAIWATTSDLGDTVIWDEDAPHPMLVTMLKEQFAKPAPKETPKLSVASSTLNKDSKGNDTADGSQPKKKEKPNFLKRVK